jgi:hypothetical protein
VRIPPGQSTCTWNTEGEWRSKIVFETNQLQFVSSSMHVDNDHGLLFCVNGEEYLDAFTASSRTWLGVAHGWHTDVVELQNAGAQSFPRCAGVGIDLPIGKPTWFVSEAGELWAYTSERNSLAGLNKELFSDGSEAPQDQAFNLYTSGTVKFEDSGRAVMLITTDHRVLVYLREPQQGFYFPYPGFSSSDLVSADWALMLDGVQGLTHQPAFAVVQPFGPEGQSVGVHYRTGWPGGSAPVFTFDQARVGCRLAHAWVNPDGQAETLCSLGGVAYRARRRAQNDWESEWFPFGDLSTPATIPTVPVVDPLYLDDHAEPMLLIANTERVVHEGGGARWTEVVSSELRAITKPAGAYAEAIAARTENDNGFLAPAGVSVGCGKPAAYVIQTTGPQNVFSAGATTPADGVRILYVESE